MLSPLQPMAAPRSGSVTDDGLPAAPPTPSFSGSAIPAAATPTPIPTATAAGPVTTTAATAPATGPAGRAKSSRGRADGCKQCVGAQLCDGMVQAFRSQQKSMQTWLEDWSAEQARALDRHHERLQTLLLESRSQEIQRAPEEEEDGLQKALLERLDLLEKTLLAQNEERKAAVTADERPTEQTTSEKSMPTASRPLMATSTRSHDIGEPAENFTSCVPGAMPCTGTTSSGLISASAGQAPKAKAVVVAQDFGGRGAKSSEPLQSQASQQQQQQQQQHQQRILKQPTDADGDAELELPFWLQGGSCFQMEDVRAVLGWQKKFPSQMETVKSRRPRCSLCCRKVKVLVDSLWFDVASFLVVVASCVLIGVDSQMNMASIISSRDGSSSSEVPAWFAVCEFVVFVFFSLEVLLKAIAEGRRFLTGPSVFWNLLDLLVLAIFVANVLGNNGTSQFMHIRILRIFRLAHLLRVIKNWASFGDLRCMLLSVTRSALPLLLILGVVSVVTYMFAIVLMNSTAEFLDGLPQDSSSDDAAIIQDLFGSLPAALLTLVSVVSGGQPWRDVASILWEANWWSAVLLVVYVEIMFFSVFNVINGIFVESVQKAAFNDSQKIILKEFDCEDSSANVAKRLLESSCKIPHMLSAPSLAEHMHSKELNAFLRLCGIDEIEAYGMYKILDWTGSGLVNIDEFLMGCMRLKGPARHVDVCTLMYENKRLVSTWSPCFEQLARSLDKLQDTIASQQSQRQRLPSQATSGTQENSSVPSESSRDETVVDGK